MEEMKVMVNGLPGNMAGIALSKIIASGDFEILPFSLTGEEVVPESVECVGKQITLIKPSQRTQFSEKLNKLFPFVAVDYTHPSAVNDNISYYCANSINFVCGTTGVKGPEAEKQIIEAGNVAVIAPNMAKQIVALMWLLNAAADTFPDAFKGYKLEIVESHQKGKADVSGTAKALVPAFNKLGAEYTVEQIKMVREPEQQLKLGVPEKNLKGHAYHTYSLKSPDGTVAVSFSHNVDGRNVYGDGTVDALRFLKKKIEQHEKGKVYSIIDVLKG